MAYISKHDYETIIAKTKPIVSAKLRQTIVPTVLFVLASIVWRHYLILNEYTHYKNAYIIAGIGLLLTYGCFAIPWYQAVLSELALFCPNCQKCGKILYPADLRILLNSDNCPRCKEKILPSEQDDPL